MTFLKEKAHFFENPGFPGFPGFLGTGVCQINFSKPEQPKHSGFDLTLKNKKQPFVCKEPSLPYLFSWRGDNIHVIELCQTSFPGFPGFRVFGFSNTLI